MAIQELSGRAKIVNEDGTPTWYFMHLMHKLGLSAETTDGDIGELIQPISSAGSFDKINELEQVTVAREIDYLASIVYEVQRDMARIVRLQKINGDIINPGTSDGEHTEGALTSLHVTDDNAISLLTKAVKELKKMNLHLSLMTDISIQNTEIE